MHFEYWHKKQVTLRWDRASFDLAVAQELFSSHEVDRGSLLLLRSLEIDALPARGRCLDYGCGYGVLGLALKGVRPEWDVTLVDRDALAVGFSAYNARALDLPVQTVGGLDPIDLTGKSYDLVLWNVPGKAGTSVLDALLDDTLDALAGMGMLALVVVHPLAETLLAVVERRTDMTLSYKEQGPEHTVMHVRRQSGGASISATDAFGRGVFDREPVSVNHGGQDYLLTPVIGLPQYDGPDYATQLVLDVLIEIPMPSPSRVLIVRPGVGHLPLAVAARWPTASQVLVDRDMLALRASGRALDQAGIPHDHITTHHAADLDGIGESEACDLSIVMLDHQMRAPVMQRSLDELGDASAPGARLIFGGGSTEVSRMMAMVRRHPALKLGSRLKRKGFSAVQLERREG